MALASVGRAARPRATMDSAAKTSLVEGSMVPLNPMPLPFLALSQILSDAFSEVMD